MPPVTVAMVGRIRAAFAGNVLEPLVTVALLTGLRQGEPLGLRWAHVEASDNGWALRVVEQVQRTHEGRVISPPKAARSRRLVPLIAPAVAALECQRAQTARQRVLAGNRWHDKDIVFTSAVGTSWEGSNASQRFRAAMRAAGLPCRFHDLRHGAASLLLAQRVSARMVMELLGHTQITLTLGTYSHILPQLSCETAEKMNAILTGGR